MKINHNKSNLINIEKEKSVFFTKNQDHFVLRILGMCILVMELPINQLLVFYDRYMIMYLILKFEKKW